MVTYPLSFPTALGIETFEYGVRHAVGRTQSPFDFSEQTVDFGGQMWKIRVTIPLMNRDTAEIYNSFLLKLRGRKGTFLIGDPAGNEPQGSFAGTPLVDGAGQTGDTINLKGFTPSASDVIKSGDWFQLGTGSTSTLHKFLEDADADTSGLVQNMPISVDIRTAPADGASIITTGAQGLFRMAANYTPISINSNTLYSVSFEAMEAI